MDLICLNCQGEFGWEGSFPEPGAKLKCPLCGAESPFFPANGRPVPRMSASTAPREAASEGKGGTFRKPQSLTMRRGSPDGGSTGPESSGTGPQPTVRRDTDSLPPIRRPLSGPVDVVAPPAEPIAEPAGPPPSSIGEGPGEWTVRSPTGLLLEFPKASLVSAWAAVVDNPAPYEVSRSGGEWMPLEVFLREVKQGSRLTQAFRALPGPGRSSVEGNASPSPGDLARAETGDPSTPASATPPVVRTPTTGFTFKVANTTKPGMSKGMKAILWVLFVSAAGAGGFFLYQYLSK